MNTIEQKNIAELSSLALLREIATGGEKQDPELISEARERGIDHFLHHLPADDTRLPILYARIAKAGIIADDPEVREFDVTMKSMARHVEQLNRMQLAEIDLVIEHLDAMKELASGLLGFFNPIVESQST